MLINFSHGVTYYSKLNLPEDAFLYQEAIDTETEMKKIKKELHLKLTGTFIVIHLETQARTEVLKCQTSYIFETDGKIKDFEVYKAYKHTMEALIQGLHQQQRQNGIQESAHLKVLTLRDLKSDIDLVVKRFHQAS